MAQRTTKTSFHRGEPRRCGWYSSRAFVAPLAGCFAGESATKLQTTALALPNGDVRIGMAEAGPPG